VVVHDFNIKSISIQPAKADPPLVIDANAVLTFPVSMQDFQAVSGRRTQKLD
jgi:hypothetical protein